MSATDFLFATAKATMIASIAGLLFWLMLRKYRGVSPNIHRLVWFGVLMLGLCVLRWPLDIPYDEPLHVPSTVITNVPQTEATYEPYREPLSFAMNTPMSATIPIENKVTSQTPAPSPIKLSSILITIWLAGIVILVVRRIFLFVQLHYRLRSLQKGTALDWERLLSQFGVAPEKIPVLWTDNAGPALVRSMFGYRLLFPQSLWDELSPEHREGVLRHELSHYLNGDAMVTELARLLVTLQWFNPISWVALRKLEEATEWRCDDFAYFNRESGPQELIETLLAVHESTESLGLYLSSFARINVITRINRLLHTHSRKENTLMKKTILLVLFLAFLLGSLLQINLVAKPQEEKKEPKKTASDSVVTAVPVEKKKSSKTVKGCVTMSDGTPVKGAKIEYKCLYAPAEVNAQEQGGYGFTIYSTTTDDKGNYTITLFMGGQYIYVIGQTYLQDEKENPTPLVSAPVAFSFDKDSQQINYTLEEGFPVTGTVRYPDGVPAVGRSVFFSRSLELPTASPIPGNPDEIRKSMTIDRNAKTDENGKYKIYLAPGEYKAMSFDSTGETRRNEEQKIVTVAKGKEPIVDFTLDKTMFVRLLHVDGSPVFPVGQVNLDAKKVVLSRKGKSGASFGSALDVNENGKMQIFPYPNENILVYMTDDGAEGIACHLPWDTDNLETIDVVLQPTAKVKIQLLDQKTKKPIANEKSYVSCSIFIEQNSSGWQYDYTTDENGNVIIPFPALGDLKGIEYSLTFRNDQKTHAKSQKFTLRTPGETVDLGEIYVETKSVVTAKTKKTESLPDGFTVALAWPETNDKERVAKFESLFDLFPWSEGNDIIKHDPQIIAKVEEECRRLAQSVELPPLRTEKILLVAWRYADTEQWEKYTALVDQLDPLFKEMAHAYRQSFEDIKAGRRDEAKERLLAFKPRISAMQGYGGAVATIFCFTALGKLGFVDEVVEQCKQVRASWNQPDDNASPSEPISEEEKYWNDFVLDRSFRDAVRNVGFFLIEHGELEKALDYSCKMYEMGKPYSCVTDSVYSITNSIIVEYVKKGELDNAMQAFDRIVRVVGNKAQFTGRPIFRALLEKEEFDRALEMTRKIDSFNTGVQNQMYFELMEYTLKHNDKEKCAELFGEGMEQIAKLERPANRLSNLENYAKIAVQMNDSAKVDQVLSAAQKYRDAGLTEKDPQAYNEISAERSKVHVLCDYATVLYLIGKTDDAKKALDDALRQADKVVDAERSEESLLQKDWAVNGIARTQTMLGLADDAFQTVTLMVDKEAKTEGYFYICNGFTHLKDLPNARKALVLARECLKEINNSRIFINIEYSEQRLEKAEKEAGM